MSQSLDIKDLELNALLEITQAINNNLAEDDLYRIYKFTLLADLKVQRLALYVKDESWQCKVHFGTSKEWCQPTLPESLGNITDVDVVTDLPEEFSEFESAIPVTHKKRLLAVILVGQIAARSDSTFLRALTNIIIVAIENKKLARKQLQQEAYRRELEIAKKVQNFLFPKHLPHTHRLKIEAVYLPHQDVGGDYYDYLAIDNDRFLVCVADVSGKGVPAALLMSNFQASLRTLVRKTYDAREIVEELNRTTTDSGNGENFITFFLGIYSFIDKSFEYVNCGHNPLYLVTNQGIQELNNGTTILGMFDPLPFLETTRIENLDHFFFFGYTDGLTETFNEKDEQYGEERVIEFLEKGIPEDLNLFHQEIFKSLDNFRGDTRYRDDITMLSCLVNN